MFLYDFLSMYTFNKNVSSVINKYRYFQASRNLKIGRFIHCSLCYRPVYTLAVIHSLKTMKK